ncbi:DNA cytosine methyltransferase [Paenibacillus motobuensis]|uniref:DNA cytosine methyltransferase n=1 Tax=Paenibacillus motobuensis TaxID=295324 RepID=UPI0036359DD4
MITNHYGYGLRNDERPFAHKIPPGGNWRDLTHEEMLVYWNGKIPTEGGSTNGLRRRSWDEPAGTITTTPMQKLSCQLHPGRLEEGRGALIINHDPKPLSAAVAQKMADGGYAQYIRKHPVAEMNKPSPAVLTQWAKGAPNGLVDPSGKEGSVNDTENHVGGVPMREYPGHSASRLDEPAKTVVAGNHGVPGGANCFYEQRKETIEIREYNVTPQLSSNGLTVTELFCGGGLMAVGLQAAGYEIEFANDFDKRAAEAYAHNIGDHVVCGDITESAIQALIPDSDVIAGGPPCQDYSVAGTGAGEEGERGKLVWAYLAIIEEKQPKAFVFENVKGLITKKHRPTFDALITKFEEIGYIVSWRVINAWDYGVAQKRERVFIVGIRKDLGITFEFPEPSADEYRTQVLRDVIGDLPEPNSGVNAHTQTRATTVRWTEGVYNQRAYKADWDTPARTVCTNRLDHAEIHPGPENHGEQMKLAADADIIPTLPEGCTGREAAKLHPEIFWSNYAREAEDSAGRTVTGEGKPKIHPTQPRRFTVRECLRIQSVPDWYVLPGSISLSAQYRIVGNGVASRVSYKIGVALAEQLNAALAELSETETEETGNPPSEINRSTPELEAVA